MDTRPAWATTIGIIFLLFGGCGIVNNVKMIRTEEMVEMSTDIISRIDIEDQEIDSADMRVLELSLDTVPMDSMQKKVDLRTAIAEMMYMSDYFKKWVVITGYVGLGVALLFIIGGIFFFTDKSITIRIALFTLVASMLFSAFRIYIFSNDVSSSVILGGITFTSCFSMFIDVVMLTVILISDKSYYLDPGEEIY